jgi:hypothetical protein
LHFFFNCSQFFGGFIWIIWSENRIPNKSEPDPDPKPDPIPSPKLLAACWSKNRTIVRNFTWIAAASGDLCGRNAAVYLATGPEYRTIVTSYGYWFVLLVRKNEQLFVLEARQSQAPSKKKTQTPEASGVFTEQV